MPPSPYTFAVRRGHVYRQPGRRRTDPVQTVVIDRGVKEVSHGWRFYLAIEAAEHGTAVLNAHGTASAGRVVVAVYVTRPGTVELVGLNITGGYNVQQQVSRFAQCHSNCNAPGP